MRKFFEFAKYRKLCIWLNELPSDRWTADQHTALRYAAEIYAAHGGRSSYGLLGGYLIQTDDDSLSIEFCLDAPPKEFHSQFASPVNLVQWGLPKEYQNGVIEGVKGHAQSQGILRITNAAYSDVNSSLSVFCGLSFILSSLFSDPSLRDVTEVEAITLYERALTGLVG